MHAYLLHNGKIHPSSAILLSPGQVGVMTGWGVFSTIRVIDGVLFAFERHFERMRRDAARMRVPFPGSPAEIEKPLLELVEANRAYQATLRVVVVRNRGGMWEGPAVDRDFDLIAFTTDLKDWGGAARLTVVRNARFAASPFAGTKILSWSYNLAWLEEAQSRGWDEALLLNERGEVSECTSANVFLCEGNRIWTPPLDSGCLPGVTREILLHELAVPGVSIGERRLTVSDLEAADEVFITSTTRGLLPVSEIEGLAVRRRGEVRNAAQAAFEEYVKAYVARIRNAYHLPAGAR
jgi:branched-subunit amino acid aminotransferase/4-amino-4-deoxychorismate lyase